MGAPDLRAIDLELNDIAGRAQSVVESMREFVRRVDHYSHSELRAIEDFVGKTREEIAALAPVSISQRRIPQAGAELSAIVRDTGEATDRIMTAAEELLACDAANLEDYRTFATERAITILESCSFHDLTGQRISKVLEALSVIESRTHRFATELGIADAPDSETELERSNRESLLNGPALADADQFLIDDLFDTSPAHARG